MSSDSSENSDLPHLRVLSPSGWSDYELLDSGAGSKLERYGTYIFIRPEHQAIWQPALPQKHWQAAHATFEANGGESGGKWIYHQPVQPYWTMTYGGLRFRAQASGSRHLGVFPEQAVHWNWIQEQVSRKNYPIRALNLFGYTGLASLAAAQVGAHVTHVDASKKAISIGRENQSLSGLDERPIRWLVDDAFKFVKREIRRGSKYEGIILDPPKFGRGPQGQVWEIFASLPGLLKDLRALLSAQPLFVILTAYAIRASALSLYYALREMAEGLGGEVEAGELALVESSSGRLLSTAIYARWSHSKEKM